MVNDATALIRNHINMLLSASEAIALGKDSRMFIKVAVCLLLTSIIGGMTDFLSLSYISKSYSCLFYLNAKFNIAFVFSLFPSMKQWFVELSLQQILS